MRAKPLTEAQLDLLDEMSKHPNLFVTSYYAPIKKLLALGFAVKSGDERYSITDEGRDALNAQENRL